METDNLAAGLDLIAATWLQQWANAGGSVQIGANRKACFYVPETSCTFEPIDPKGNRPEWLRGNDATFRSGLYTGKMRAMLDLLEALPGGKEAVKHHMLLHGMTSFVGNVACSRTDARPTNDRIPNSRMVS
jgi:hypothetical protein